MTESLCRYGSRKNNLYRVVLVLFLCVSGNSQSCDFTLAPLAKRVEQAKSILHIRVLASEWVVGEDGAADHTLTKYEIIETLKQGVEKPIIRELHLGCELRMQEGYEYIVFIPKSVLMGQENVVRITNGSFRYYGTDHYSLFHVNQIRYAVKESN